MDNDTILEVKELFKNIDYLEINLSNQFNKNNVMYRKYFLMNKNEEKMRRNECLINISN